MSLNSWASDLAWPVVTVILLFCRFCCTTDMLSLLFNIVFASNTVSKEPDIVTNVPQCQIRMATECFPLNVGSGIGRFNSAAIRLKYKLLTIIADCSERGDRTLDLRVMNPTLLPSELPRRVLFFQ